MPSHNTAEPRSTPQQTLPDRSGGQLKAELSETSSRSVPIREQAADALRAMGSQKTAALDLKLSEGRLSSKLKDGSLTIRHLEQFGADYASEFGEALVKKYGRTNPKANAVEALKDARRELDRAIDLLTEAIS